MLVSINEQFQKDLTVAVIEPIILPSEEGQGHRAHVGDSGIHVDPEPSHVSVSEVLDCIVNVLGYLRRCLPESILSPLSESFIPALSSKLISFWLSPAIPTDLPGLDEFEKTLNHVVQFCDTLESLGWHGQEELASWASQAPRIWLGKRRVDSLDRVRKVLGASQYTTRHVERVETEDVSHTDPDNDDWDSAWDGNNEGNEGLTLKEKYTITDIPDSILEIVRQQVADAKALSQPRYVKPCA